MTTPTPKRKHKAIRPTVNDVTKNGKRMWVLSYFVEGKRKVRFFPTREEAEAEARALIEAATGQGGPRCNFAAGWVAGALNHFANEKTQVYQVTVDGVVRFSLFGQHYRIQITHEGSDEEERAKFFEKARAQAERLWVGGEEPPACLTSQVSH